MKRFTLAAVESPPRFESAAATGSDGGGGGGGLSMTTGTAQCCWEKLAGLRLGLPWGCPGFALDLPWISLSLPWARPRFATQTQTSGGSISHYYVLHCELCSVAVEHV
ncbi:hypothetical protein KPH14_006430 [Odynerus spinipes]|uniref:Uncharacterized protein n=1 Tax=Odynerus spinipes TaxID=1348599 RepID=A0AAD9VR19_9HYME|nr:hypothetical protein KPH14_006430 [Odynerus spinipes]